MTRRSLPVLAVLLMAAGVFVMFSERRSAAQEEPKPVHTVYVSIQGEGTTAKAWYRGAPPTGVDVQTAFDNLSRDGYRVVEMGSSTRPTILTTGTASAPPLAEETWVVLMEKR